MAVNVNVVPIALLLILLCCFVKSQDGTAASRFICSEGQIVTVQEGANFEICSSRDGEFSTGDISVNIVEGFGSDFVGEFPRRIKSEENCATIQAFDDNNFERNEAFTLSLTSDDGSHTVNCTLVLIDNDGPDIECSDNFVATQNISQVLQARSCSIPELECPDHPPSIDCIRWEVTHNLPLLSGSSLLEVPADLFPSIDSEFRTDSNLSCLQVLVSQLQPLINATKNADPTENTADKDCLSACTVTLTRGCDLLSVFLLEGVYAHSGFNESTIEIPGECGSLTISFCPSSCPETDSGDSVQVVVGGVVGGVVGLAILIGAAVFAAVLILLCIKKHKKQWTVSSSTGVQPKVYKPRRTDSSAAASFVSQDTITTTTSLTLESGISSVASRNTSSAKLTLQPPNYEEINYAETYSEWKKKFTKVMVDFNHLEYGEMIGEGEFSTVFCAKYTADGRTSKEVAVKNLKTISKEEIGTFVAESAIMMEFDHPNILHLIGVCFNTPDSLPAIILPYMANGDLRTFLRAKKNQHDMSKGPKADYPEGLSRTILLEMCMDIAQGMYYLSKCKFVHRDLAARNCMIDKNLKVKVADFGLSRDIHMSDYYRSKRRQKLPVKWMAPESLFKKLYTEKTDVWSFGIVCWEIFKLGKKPYAGIDNPDLPGYISHGYRLKKPSRSPEALFELMQDTWMEDPEERPTFRTIVLALSTITGRRVDIDDSDGGKVTTTHEKEHTYHLLEPPALQNKESRAQEEPAGQQDEPEPVYYNKQLESPEVYEVPVPTVPTTTQSTSSSFPEVYEEVAVRSLSQPEEYEVPVSLSAPESSSSKEFASSSLPPQNLSQSSEHEITQSAITSTSSRQPRQKRILSPSSGRRSLSPSHLMKTSSIPVPEQTPNGKRMMRQNTDDPRLMELNYLPKERGLAASLTSLRERSVGGADGGGGAVINGNFQRSHVYHTLESNHRRRPDNLDKKNHIYHSLEPNRRKRPQQQ